MIRKKEEARTVIRFAHDKLKSKLNQSRIKNYNKTTNQRIESKINQSRIILSNYDSLRLTTTQKREKKEKEVKLINSIPNPL